MFVYILNKDGKPLMPTYPSKARLLLKAGKAKVVQRTPFTIQLLYGSSGYKQDLTLGVDSGFKHIGLSAVSEKAELFSSEVKLRTDMVDLNSERLQYRRTRRHRKTRYRQSRFLNRRKPEGWLAPSIQHKLDSHKKVVAQVCSLLPVSQIVVEVTSFDIQKIKNPDVSDFAYQMGEQLGYQNVRQYVIERDGRQCQGQKRCKAERWEVHHLVSRKTGGDRPENLILLCDQCHALYHAGNLTLKVKPSPGFKAESFMSMVRWRLIGELQELYRIPVRATFGYLTKFRRKALALKKSHATDAFVIAGGATQPRNDARHFQQQVRKQNRKLFKGAHSHLKNTAPRFVHGFQRFDKVLFQQTECFVFGRRSTGYFDLKTLDGAKVHASAKAKELRLLEFASTLLIEQKIAA